MYNHQTNPQLQLASLDILAESKMWGRTSLLILSVCNDTARVTYTSCLIGEWPTVKMFADTDCGPAASNDPTSGGTITDGTPEMDELRSNLHDLADRLLSHKSGDAIIKWIQWHDELVDHAVQFAALHGEVEFLEAAIATVEEIHRANSPTTELVHPVQR